MFRKYCMVFMCSSKTFLKFEFCSLSNVIFTGKVNFVTAMRRPCGIY